ncbi:MAG: tail fiber domain-containing protein [Bacteroidales bacterium]|jgi:uncharacterized protein (UPF0333 family)|nr:tail fiber domain-containing protein [Bacteroidales bacterium]
MRKLRLLTLRKQVTLVVIFITVSILTNAQIIKATGTVGTDANIDINAQTVITNLVNSDGLSIITRNSTTTLSSGNDLIWGGFYQAQPNNPNIFGLMSISAQQWVNCFVVKANGNTGIFNNNPSVALEIGSSSNIRQVKVNGNIVWGSDVRMKENIKDLSSSLDQLKQLQSVSYNLKEEKKEEVIPEKFLADDVDIEALKTEISKVPKHNEYLLSRNFYGFLAQDVQKLFPDLVYADDEGMLSVDYIGMIPLLVNGLQEQQQLIENLQQKEVEFVKEQIRIQQEIEALREVLNTCCKITQSEYIMDESNAVEKNSSIHSERMVLYQNAPNPFNETTTIQCYIPKTIQKAELCIYNMQGTQVKCVSVSERGSVNIQILAGQLTSGIYTYLLIGDKQTGDAKQMVLTK